MDNITLVRVEPVKPATVDKLSFAFTQKCVNVSSRESF